MPSSRVFVPLVAMIVACTVGRFARVFSGVFAVVSCSPSRSGPYATAGGPHTGPHREPLDLLPHQRRHGRHRGRVSPLADRSSGRSPHRCCSGWCACCRPAGGESSSCRSRSTPRSRDPRQRPGDPRLVVPLDRRERRTRPARRPCRATPLLGRDGRDEHERVAVAALMHDSVLGALLAADRAHDPARERSFAVSMAREALTGWRTPRRTPSKEATSRSPRCAWPTTSRPPLASSGSTDVVRHVDEGTPHVPGRIARALVSRRCRPSPTPYSTPMRRASRCS